MNKPSNEKLIRDKADLIKLCNEILDSIELGAMITGEMLEDWDQERYHIEYRVK